MRRQRIAMVQTVDQYMLCHRAVRELFLEQMRVIDSHPYENVGDDGRPLAGEQRKRGLVLSLTNCRLSIPFVSGRDSDTVTPDYETIFIKGQGDAVDIEKVGLSLNLKLLD